MPTCPQCQSTLIRRSAYRPKSAKSLLQRFFRPWFRCNECSTKFQAYDSLAVQSAVIGLLLFALAGSVTGWAVSHYPAVASRMQSDASSVVKVNAASGAVDKTEPLRDLDELRAEAKQGDVEAQFRLGLSAFERTWGSLQQSEVVEAIDWLSKAAAQGDANAQLLLGALYQQGKGVIQNYHDALGHYSRAADKGHALAMSRLGIMLMEGAGVEPNPVEAYVWLNLAAARGDTNAEMYRNALQRKLAQADLLAAQTRSSEKNKALPILNTSFFKLPLGL